MYPTDIKEFTASRLVAHIAQALNTGAPLELRPLYDELGLSPSTIASYHAAAAAVHVLLAHVAGQAVATDPLQLPSPVVRGNGHPKDSAGEPAQPRQSYQRAGKKGQRKSSSTRKSVPQTGKALLKCAECGRPFRTQGRLTNHLRDQHGAAPAQPEPTATAATAA